MLEAPAVLTEDADARPVVGRIPVPALRGVEGDLTSVEKNGDPRRIVRRAGQIEHAGGPADAAEDLLERRGELLGIGARVEARAALGAREAALDRHLLEAARQPAGIVLQPRADAQHD